MEKSKSKSKALRKTFYDRPCLVCGSVPSDPAHLRSFGATGEDDEINLIPLCRYHHTFQHKVGWFKMMEEYPLLEAELPEWFVEFLNRRK